MEQAMTLNAKHVPIEEIMQGLDVHPQVFREAMRRIHAEVLDEDARVEIQPFGVFHRTTQAETYKIYEQDLFLMEERQRVFLSTPNRARKSRTFLDDIHQLSFSGSFLGIEGLKIFLPNDTSANIAAEIKHPDPPGSDTYYCQTSLWGESTSVRRFRIDLRRHNQGTLDRVYIDLTWKPFDDYDTGSGTAFAYVPAAQALSTTLRWDNPGIVEPGMLPHYDATLDRDENETQGRTWARALWTLFRKQLDHAQFNPNNTSQVVVTTIFTG